MKGKLLTALTTTCCGLAVVAVVAAVVASLAAAEPAAARAAEPNAGGGAYDDIDAYLRERMSSLDIPGMATAIVEGEEVAHVRGFGKARPGGETPAAATPFGIGSLTKSFTALAVMQLVEAGRIELDAPVTTYLPWFRLADREASARITVRQLLNQTSGLPQLPGMVLLADFDDRPDATERQVRGLATLTLARAPGSSFEYSNLNYNILGLIIEAASGETYAAYLQRHVFDPLDMRHTYTSLAAAQRDGLAVGHRFWFGVPVAVKNPRTPAGSLPAGQIISCAEDMAHYLTAHLRGGRYGGRQILSPAGMAELHRPAVEATTMGISFGHYAMGWFVEKQSGTTMITHDGITPDFFAYMAVLPEQGKAMVLLANVNHVMMEKLSLLDMGSGEALRLAGGTAPEPAYDVVPWALRCLLLVPVLQLAGVALTLRRLRSWRGSPPPRGRAGVWVRHLVVPLLPNLVLVAAPLSILASGLWEFMWLFLPDVALLALVSGGFAGVWAALRSWLVWRALRGPGTEARPTATGC
jgi:CubicO group peptidase (beta-lactamase class C family)